MHRREFLRALGAAGITVTALAGCATGGRAHAAGKVVVVGGGYGGATAAKYLNLWSGGAVDVTLVEAEPAFVSCPMSNLVLGGSRQIGDLTVSYEGLARRGIRRVHDTATAVDADKRIVKLASGNELRYDRLILSPGIAFLYARVPGLDTVEAQARVLHAWKAGAQTVALRRQIEATDERAIDVAILDMNHGWPNLGHDSLVHAVLDTGCDLIPMLEGTGLHIRALSFDVRRAGLIPESPNGRFSLYLGTGGPGHIDPRLNDGVAEGAQGIRENPGWEAPLFRLFDAIQAKDGAALLSVCHTFGVMCRWSGAAQPVLRGPDKGGKSTGILENVLTPEAEAHPWFRRFAEELADGHRLRVVDNRLFDLIPNGRLPEGAIPIGYETRGLGGPRGEALTMLEFARDAGGVMPRVFGVNHHPEIVDRARQTMILKQKLERGEVSPEWYAERLEILTRHYPDEDSDRRLHQTSDYTLLAPLQFYIHRQVRQRAEALGLRVDLHENRILERVEQDTARRS